MSNWFQVPARAAATPQYRRRRNDRPLRHRRDRARSLACGRNTSAGNSEHVLTAHTEDGAEVQWHMRFFADTRACRMLGRADQPGQPAAAKPERCLTWDLDLSLQPAFGEPWIRRVNGVQFLANFFPPHDFAIVDRQLLKTPQVYAPFDIMAGDGGRPSDGHLPCAIVCDGSRSQGLRSFLNGPVSGVSASRRDTRGKRPRYRLAGPPAGRSLGAGPAPAAGPVTAAGPVSS